MMTYKQHILKTITFGFCGLLIACGGQGVSTDENDQITGDVNSQTATKREYCTVAMNKFDLCYFPLTDAEYNVEVNACIEAPCNYSPEQYFESLNAVRDMSCAEFVDFFDRALAGEGGQGCG